MLDTSPSRVRSKMTWPGSTTPEWAGVPAVGVAEDCTVSADPVSLRSELLEVVEHAARIMRAAVIAGQSPTRVFAGISRIASQVSTFHRVIIVGGYRPLRGRALLTG